MYFILFFIFTFWSKVFIGDSTDEALSVCLSHDGGYVVAGGTWSFGVSDCECLVIKLDSLGNMVWSKTLGGVGLDEIYSVKQTQANGYILGGYTGSFGAGNADFLIIKIDSIGNVKWAKTYGGTEVDLCYSIQQTKDMGYILAGTTNSFGAGDQDFLIIKLDSIGNIKWAKTYGDTATDFARTIQQTYDNGYIVSGYSWSFGAGLADILLIKLDSLGNVEWAKTYGGNSFDWSRSVQQTKDSGFIVTATTRSFGLGSYDFLLIKLNSLGNIDWCRTFGGDTIDAAFSSYQTNDNGYIVAGRSLSFGFGNSDFLILKLTSVGDIEWANTFGGIDNDYPYEIYQTKDSGYIVVGETYSFGVGNSNFLVIKIDRDGNMGSNCPWQPFLLNFTFPSVDTSSPSLSIVTPVIEKSVCSLTVTSPSIIEEIICSEGCDEKSVIINSIEVFPTITRNAIKIKSNAAYVLEIIDLTGRVIDKIFCQKESINYNASKLKKGIYFLMLNNKKVITKFVVI